MGLEHLKSEDQLSCSNRTLNGANEHPVTCVSVRVVAHVRENALLAVCKNVGIWVILPYFIVVFWF